MYKKRIPPKELGGGKRIIFDKKDLEKVEELAGYLTTEQIADNFGVSRDTFYELRKRQPEIALQYQKGRSRKILQYAKQLEDKALGRTDKGDTVCIIFFLKTQAGWKEAKDDKSAIDMSVSFNISEKENENDIKIANPIGMYEQLT